MVLLLSKIRSGKVIWMGGVVIAVGLVLLLWPNRGQAYDGRLSRQSDAAYCGNAIDVVFIAPEAVNLEAIAQILLLDRALTCKGEPLHTLGVIAWKPSSDFDEGEQRRLKPIGVLSLTELTPFQDARERSVLWPYDTLKQLSIPSLDEQAFLASLEMAKEWLSQSKREGRRQFVVYVGPAAFDKKSIPYPLAMKSRIEALREEIGVLRENGITFLAYVHENQRSPDYAEYTWQGWRDVVGEKALQFVQQPQMDEADVIDWLMGYWRSDNLLPAVVPVTGERMMIPAGMSSVALTWVGASTKSFTVASEALVLPPVQGESKAFDGVCKMGENELPCQVVHEASAQSILITSPPSGAWHGSISGRMYLQWEPPSLRIVPPDTPLPQDRGQAIEDNASLVAHLWGRGGNVSDKDVSVTWQGDSGDCGALQFVWDDIAQGWRAEVCRKQPGAQKWQVAGTVDVSFGTPRHFSVKLQDSDSYEVFPVSVLSARVFISTVDKSVETLRSSDDAPWRVAIHHVDFTAWHWPFLLREIAPLNVVVGLFDEEGKQIPAAVLTNTPDNFVRVRVRTPEGALSPEVVLKYNPSAHWWEGKVVYVPSHTTGDYYLWVDVGKTFPEFYWKKIREEGQEIVFRRVDPPYLWGALWLLILVVGFWGMHTYWCPDCSALRRLPGGERWLHPWGYVEFYATFRGQLLKEPLGRYPVRCKYQKFSPARLLQETPVLPYEEVEVKWGKTVVSVVARYRPEALEGLKNPPSERVESIPVNGKSKIGIRGIVIRVVDDKTSLQGTTKE